MCKLRTKRAEHSSNWMCPTQDKSSEQWPTQDTVSMYLGCLILNKGVMCGAISLPEVSQ